MSQWENVMQKHAKSFYLASLFFPRKLLPKVKALYALCRWLDDAVDEAPSSKAANLALEKIANDLHSPSSKLPVNIIYKQNKLDIGYIEDLIQGAKDDLTTVRIQDEEELIRYSYKVAGTVGLAMFDLMGVHPPLARANAVDLGIAMQITNICRDVKEDLERNRIYVPIKLLEHYKISEEQLKQGTYDEKQLSLAMTELVSRADLYYDSARLAFQNIPWRSRGAIIIASELYRSIGVKLIRKGGNPMKGRTYLKTFEKLWVVTKSLGLWFISSFRTNLLTHNPELHRSLEPWRSLRSFES